MQHTLKSTQPALRRGFTLVELLIAIAIIATLSAISYSVVFKQLKEAKVKETQAIIRSLEDGIEGFYTDYNILLYDKSENEFKLTENTPETIFILSNLDARELEDTDYYNTRNKRYLNIDDSDSGSNGIVRDTQTGLPKGLKDSWGTDFITIWDADLDGKIKLNNNPSIWESPDEVNGKRVLIYSCGPDRKSGTADDILSWR